MQVQGNFIPSGSTVYQSAAVEETKQLAAGPGLLHVLMITNFNAAQRWVYVFDSLTASGTPLIPPIPVQLTGTVGSSVVVPLPASIPFTTGLFVASSSTGPTYTASAANDLRMTAYLKK